MNADSSTLESLLKYVRENGRVCPMPRRWNELWKMLPDRRRVGDGWEPPLPLILGAWWDAPAHLKILRLEEHIRYANAHGVFPIVDRYLRQLSDDDWAYSERLDKADEDRANKPLFEVGWEVQGVRVAVDFFSAVPKLLPLPVHLCFQGTSIEEDVWQCLNTRAVPPLMQIPSGTIWPKSRTVHVLADTDFLRALALLADRHAEPEICDHLHAYNESQPLIQWHDAFCAPLLISESVPEPKIRDFCEQLRATYKPF